MFAKLLSKYKDVKVVFKSFINFLKKWVKPYLFFSKASLSFFPVTHDFISFASSLLIIVMKQKI